MNKTLGKLACCLVLMTSSVSSYSQTYTQINRALFAGEYEKAKEKLDKKIQKHPRDVEALSKLSLYFSIDPKTKHYSLDSAYYYTLAAIAVFSSESDIKKLGMYDKLGLNGVELEKMRHSIERAAFRSTRARGTLESYTAYVIRFPESSLYRVAAKSRDSIAFLKAEKVGDFAAYKHFLDLYPQADEGADAKKRYDKLLYEQLTKVETAKSYEDFINSYPSSPYIQQAEKKLYTKFTSDNRTSTLSHFITRFPQNHLTAQAWMRLWYMTPEQLRPELYAKLGGKHLPNFLGQDQARLYPTWDSEKQLYGLIDDKGNIVMAAQLKNLSDEYICSGITAPYLIAEQANAYAIYGKKWSSQNRVCLY